MPVQRYTAQEIVRKNVQRKATGMTREQVAAETRTAQGWERGTERGPQELGGLEPGRLEALRLARWKHTEWRRIGSVMAEEAMDLYTPERDSRVQEMELRRLERVTAEAEVAERKGKGPVEVEENRVYRVVAERISASLPGVSSITVHLEAPSVAEAAMFALRENEREGGLYGVGRYRIIRAEEDLLGADGELEALRAFVQRAARSARAHSTARRRALEALGEAGNLCNATTVHSPSGVRLTCTREAGHYNPQDPPARGRPGGWHIADTTTWTDDEAESTPHRPA
ncbi:hypothetical protein ACFPFX_37660 [Streptomyces mauvecolor]|uniref:DUF5753 domain-containing protein n=1 Tax=Streptomyces mauvecolor TaxID=58345 RepID=A0ABV9UZZ6_9ACTN